LQILPQIFRIDLPEDLIDAVTNAKQMHKQVGIEWAIQQSRELKAAGVPVNIFDGNWKSEKLKESTF
jgi:methylenetetrahydrofolate reductase (NADPH)